MQSVLKSFTESFKPWGTNHTVTVLTSFCLNKRKILQVNTDAGFVMKTNAERKLNPSIQGGLRNQTGWARRGVQATGGRGLSSAAWPYCSTHRRFTLKPGDGPGSLYLILLGGGTGDQTLDLALVRQAAEPLSYNPGPVWIFLKPHLQIQSPRTCSCDPDLQYFTFSTL